MKSIYFLTITNTVQKGSCVFLKCVSLLNFRINVCCLCGFSLKVWCQVHRLELNPAKLCSSEHHQWSVATHKPQFAELGPLCFLTRECQLFSLNSLWHTVASYIIICKWYLTLSKLALNVIAHIRNGRIFLKDKLKKAKEAHCFFSLRYFCYIFQLW